MGGGLQTPMHPCRDTPMHTIPVVFNGLHDMEKHQLTTSAESQCGDQAADPNNIFILCNASPAKSGFVGIQEELKSTAASILKSLSVIMKSLELGPSELNPENRESKRGREHRVSRQLAPPCSRVCRAACWLRPRDAAKKICGPWMSSCSVLKRDDGDEVHGGNQLAKWNRRRGLDFLCAWVQRRCGSAPRPTP